MNILNNKKIWIILFIIVLLILLIKIFFFPSTNKQIKKILKNDGFRLESDIYTKQTSKLSRDEYYDNIDNNINSYNETMYFDINTYELKKVSMDYYNGMTITLNLNYSYEDEYVSFTYEATENKKGALFTGDYYSSGDTFECRLMDSNKDILSKTNQQTICNTIEKEVNHFYDESQDLFKNTNLINKISKIYN